MIGLVLIFFIGRPFYELARLNNKSPWPFAILGVISYYGGPFAVGIIIGILLLLDVLTANDFTGSGFALIELPVGLLSSWMSYRMLKAHWRRKTNKVQEEILDGDLLK